MLGEEEDPEDLESGHGWGVGFEKAVFLTAIATHRARKSLDAS
jgi:hypothetical protein